MAFLKRAWRLFFAAGLLTAAHSALAQSSEHKLEAAYLCRFIDYIEWPASANASTNSPIVIGILGRDPFGSALGEVAEGQMSKGHPIQIRHFISLAEIGDCQELFISASEAPKLASILHDLGGRPIITVSDINQFAERGGMIHFYTEANKVRFQINLDAAKSSDLSISSRLLQLAEIVNTKPPAP